MDDTPLALRERPAVRGDLQALTDLYCAYDRVVVGAPDTDPDDVLADWDRPGADLAQDTLVLEVDGRLVGYAVQLGHEADSCVDPDGPVDALYGRLLDWLEQRGTSLQHYTAEHDPFLPPLLEARGWTVTRRFWRMRRELDVAPPDPVWPEGVQVREHRRPDDDAPVHALVTAAFREVGGQAERSLEQWTASLLEGARFDPSLCLVATVDGEVVGAALSRATSDFGFVRQLAVAPSQRGRGLALALLHECFRRHRERGLPATALGVDAANPTGALALYEKAGMRVVERFARWERATAADVTRPAD